MSEWRSAAVGSGAVGSGAVGSGAVGSGAVGSGAVGSAVAALAAGRPVVLTTPDGEGSLVTAADTVTTEQLAFLVRHTSGFVCVALTSRDCDRLGLPRMYPHDPASPPAADYRVTVDAAAGISTGISAHDRALTARLLADPCSPPTALVRPGHVMPVAAAPGGVLEHQGDAEAGVELATLAGLPPAAVFGRIVSVEHPERMAGHAELERFRQEHGLPIVGVHDLVAYRLSTRRPVVCPFGEPYGGAHCPPRRPAGLRIPAALHGPTAQHRPAALHGPAALHVPTSPPGEVA